MTETKLPAKIIFSDGSWCEAEGENLNVKIDNKTDFYKKDNTIDELFNKENINWDN